MQITEEIREMVEYHIIKTLNRIGVKMKGEIKDLIRDHGKIAWERMVNNVAYNILRPTQTSFELVIGTNAKYVKYVVEGRSPGKIPPIKPIREWVRKKAYKFNKTGFMGLSGKNNSVKKIDSIAFAVARGIGKNGIKPFPFFNIILDQNEKYINDQYELMKKEINERLK